MLITTAEAQALIDAHRGGDPNALNQLARLSRPVLVRAARRYARVIELEDALQIASMGMLTAVNNFDGRSKWSSYCYGWARSALDQERRLITATKRFPDLPPLSMDAPDAQGSTLHERVSGPQESEEHSTNDADLPALLEALTEHQRGIVERVLHGEAIQAIALDLGVSHQAVSDAYGKAVQRMRRALALV